MQYAVSLLLASLCYFLITGLMFLIHFVCLFSVSCIPCFFRIVCVFFFSFCIQLSPSNLVQFHRPLPGGGKPNTVNKCHIIFMIVTMMMMIMIMKSLTSRGEIFIVEQKGIWCVLLGHTCL